MKKEKAMKTALIVSGALTLIICGVMNLYLIPAIESTTQGLRIFDMCSFGYTYEDAVKMVSLLSEDGKSIYLFRQLPLDFFYPVAYMAFFSLTIIKLRKDKKILLVLPALLMLCDYTENIFSEIMLRTDFSAGTARAASSVTVTKTILMYAVIAVILILLFMYFRGKKRNNS